MSIRTMIKGAFAGSFLACLTFMNASAQDFTGAYVGGSISAGVYEGYRGDSDGFLTDNSSWIATDFRPGFAFQLGHDWQEGNRVFGLAGDFTWLGADVTIQDNPNGGDPTPNEITCTLDWMLTFRGRVGLAQDGTLFYLTGGLAVSGIDTSFQDAELHETTGTRLGLAGGIGTEFILSENWSLGGEFLYTKFAPESVEFTETATDYRFDLADTVTQVKVAVNYRL